MILDSSASFIGTLRPEEESEGKEGFRGGAPLAEEEEE
jgi:hypothetical protein